MLRIVPITLEDANLFVERYHRHHKPTPGHKFSVAVGDEAGSIHGVAIVGRPVSRVLDDGWVLEVNRVCTNGARNACSMLYRACWRVTVALGYRRLITYTLPQEGGASLRGAGFRLIGQVNGGRWNTPARPRVDRHPTQAKLVWDIST